MVSIVSSSLLHFTNRFNALKGILSKGFRYSYCREEFPDAVIYNMLNQNCNDSKACNYISGGQVGKDVLIPMVSFCDVPLTRAEVHFKNYGNYAIGIDKEIAKNCYVWLQPVQYMTDYRYRMSITELSMLLKAKEVLSRRQTRDSIYQVLGTSKPYNILRKGKVVNCYDEREWRVLGMDDTSMPWIPGVTGKAKIEMNKRLHKCNDIYLSFIVDEDQETHKIIEDNICKLITHIIVKNESQVAEIVDYIINPKKKIFGYELSTEVRNKLVSRVSSYERISKDY